MLEAIAASAGTPWMRLAQRSTESHMETQSATPRTIPVHGVSKGRSVGLFGCLLVEHSLVGLRCAHSLPRQGPAQGQGLEAAWRLKHKCPVKAAVSPTDCCKPTVVGIHPLHAAVSVVHGMVLASDAIKTPPPPPRPHPHVKKTRICMVLLMARPTAAPPKESFSPTEKRQVPSTMSAPSRSQWKASHKCT